MGKVNSALDGLRPSGSLLQQMFEGLGNSISDFAGKVWDVVSVTLGVMLRDIIEGMISAIGDLVGSIIDAGSQFQTLKIRLTGLNLNETVGQTKSFSQAMAEANKQTSEQLTWLQTLGAATPFDPAAITNVYTLARSYGFAADEAKRLTKDTIEFTAGMGLGNDVLELVIRNFGQMVQRGKITSTEMRDLARGSFLPLSDVLERIAKNMGITVKELSKKITTPTGVPAQEFIKAFESMVEEEPRFVGAAGRLSRALIPASNNVKELFTSILGLNVVTPLFDVLGEKVAGFVDQFVTFNQQGDLIKTDKWTTLVGAATGLGAALSSVLTQILGLIPNSVSLSDALLSGIKAVTRWVNIHRGDIVGFFKGIADAIQNDLIPFIVKQLIPALVGIVSWVWANKGTILGFFQGLADLIATTLIPFIQNQLLPAFNQISQWVTDNKELISGFFWELGQIIATVFSNLTGGNFAGGDALKSILDSVKLFMAEVILNKDKIAEWATILIQVFLAVQLLITVFNIIVGVLMFVGGIILSVVAAVASLISFVTIASAVISAFGIPLLIIITAIVMVRYYLGLLGLAFQELRAAVLAVGASIATGFLLLSQNLINTVNNIMTSIRNRDWLGVGKAIIQGIINGIGIMAGTLVGAAVNAVTSAYNAARKFLGVRSPSTLFADLGELTMQGMAKGIENMAGLASQTMTAAVSKIAMPAITMPSLIQTVMAQGGGSTTTNTDTKNFNLAIHSSASTEPIVQDFNMLKSLSGA